MGYVIVAGVGLAIGLGLMIWALRERSRRHEAERAADAARKAADESARIADANCTVTARLKVEIKRLTDQIASQRDRLAEARELLKRHGSMNTIKAWLDDEGEGGTI
jgi:hypothetical protein